MAKEGFQDFGFQLFFCGVNIFVIFYVIMFV